MTRPILLVEDNPDDVELTLRAFDKKKLANPIAIARDGQEALDFIFGPDDEVPALVLLDLRLPKVSGLEVLQRIRADEHLRSLPVVVLTTSSEESDIVASYDLGANSFVRKPVDFSQFIEAVQTLGLYWMVVNTTPDSGAVPERDAGRRAAADLSGSLPR